METKQIPTNKQPEETPRLHTLNNTEPHPDWGGWRGFLDTCEVRDEADGVIFYGKTNCNYLLFPSGLILQNFGYWGRVVMNRIRKEGVAAIEAEARARHEGLGILLDKSKILLSAR